MNFNFVFILDVGRPHHPSAINPPHSYTKALQPRVHLWSKHFSLKAIFFLFTNFNRHDACYRWRGRRFVGGTSALGRQPSGREDLRWRAKLPDVSTEPQKVFRSVSSGGQVKDQPDGRRGVAVPHDRQQELREWRRKPM